MKSINPATEEVLATYKEDDTGTVYAQLDTAREAFESWSERSVSSRERLLANVADVLRENIDKYAKQITIEVGKPLDQAVSEIEKCVWVCNYYSQHSSEYLQNEHIGTEPGAKTYVSYEPLGAILAIMPWNYPFWQVFRFAAPHITSGNVAILKHSPNVFGCAQAIEDIFEEAGYPDGVFTSVQVSVNQVSDIIEDDRVRAVTLTGSTRAGKEVATISGRELKPTVFELGGSDPFVVLDDAPVERAAEVGATARTQNAGQSCIAAKRFIVHETVFDEFLERLTTEFKALTIGDPTDVETDVGPLAREDLLETLHDQVMTSVDAGATLHLGGEPLDQSGYFYPPTILVDVPDETPAATEELFGPVATVFKVESEREALRIANDTQYGLGASVWTTNTDRGESVAQELEAGNVFVNQLVKSDPRVPFSGVKDSGYGTELSRHGIHEFVNKKTIWIEGQGE
ncbi:Aldehyde Dehydrogenase (plasmid) [Haloterrigena turkmenica DSM 5511]|uniref:Aldehyde Dehydrogenase n=1 Tax=Haloterrigena turkmenica (strain ATCC 51198 / DSM 5511 / JCM 9101 / NCIMB 13204 / VKM B-1734 / 4k) TaxID=543526 RepID=D2S0J9_HALTV|nr:NAD-dependent succinate-semialdehyde dehydrogenase [Haloterrigena turkmenica]ADB62896.1 Aldehyde Dehydrogenase [Haloterrigena turkmenica DSM 5511]